MSIFRIIILFLGIAVLGLLFSGCATVDSEQKTSQESRIKRLSAEELERLTPKPVPNLALEELVTLSKSGMSADELIEKIKQSGTRYALTPSEVIELNKQGVDSKVLDYLYTAQQQALRDSFADDISRRDAEHRKQMDQLMQELLRRPYPYDPFWPYHPYWRGGW